MAFYDELDPNADLGVDGFTASMTLSGDGWDMSPNGAATVTVSVLPLLRQATYPGPVADINELKASVVIAMMDSLKSHFGNFPTEDSSATLSWGDVHITQTGEKRGSYSSSPGS